jgi:uncharacterized protein (DUF1501 family)
MPVTRREFIRGGVAAFTVGFAAPSFLCDLARAQGSSRRNLVVVYLSGGNDALSTLVPYTDTFYYSRRPTLAVPAGEVLQIGSDRSGKALGLHPRLSGLKSIFDQGRLAIVQRAGYENSSRSHFYGNDVWSTANPQSPTGPGWLGRYLDTLPAPVDPLAGWATTQDVPHSMQARLTAVPAIPNVQSYAFASPNTGADAQLARSTATTISSHVPIARPHLAFVNGTARAAFDTLDRVGAVAGYQPSTTYPNTGFGLAMRAVAGALAKGTGTKIFWVQTGGYDTHAGQGTNGANGAYGNLMTTLSDGLLAFHDDLKNQGLLGDTLILQWSEFARRISENGSQGTDHGAAGIMLALGGAVQGGLIGTAPSLNPTPDNPTLENSANDVRYETDFRSVYARVIDNWLGGDSVAILGGNYRNPAISFI